MILRFVGSLINTHDDDDEQTKPVHKRNVTVFSPQIRFLLAIVCVYEN